MMREAMIVLIVTLVRWFEKRRPAQGQPAGTNLG
jgi:hypothetical protein